MKQSSLNLQREELITASIPFVLEQGWSEKALSEACLSLSKDLKYWEMFFPNMSDVVEFFEKSEDARMIRVIANYGDLEGVRNKIGKALFERIVHISGGIEMLKKLEEFYCSKISSATTNIWQTADVIWIFAGDKSTDFNHYTKRTLLSGVYVAVVRHVAASYSNDHDNSEIQQYISDALDKVIKLGSFKKYLKLPKMENIPILRMFS